MARADSDRATSAAAALKPAQRAAEGYNAAVKLLLGKHNEGIKQQLEDVAVQQERGHLLNAFCEQYFRRYQRTSEDIDRWPSVEYNAEDRKLQAIMEDDKLSKTDIKELGTALLGLSWSKHADTLLR